AGGAPAGDVAIPGGTLAGPMRRHGPWLAGVLVLVLVATLAFAVRFGPALVFFLALAVPATEKWLAPFEERVVREDVVLPARPGGLHADPYRPAHPGRSPAPRARSVPGGPAAARPRPPRPVVATAVALHSRPRPSRRLASLPGGTLIASRQKVAS
ncbi:MAG TPA: hypothetical protein VEL75_23245, partial [Candidatus Methylomirabilis sp.]|nr:hypothetical protein [Candidatus Methylomirabilis sp.]